MVRNSKKRSVGKVLLILLLIVVVTGISGFVYINRSTMGRFIPIETKQVTDNVYVIKDVFVNSYLIKTNNKYIAIDAGNNIDSFKVQFDTLGISSEDVIAVLLTHSDSDHTAGLSIFTNADVYLPEQEVQMVDGSVNRGPFMENKLDVNYKIIKDQEEINIDGVKIKSILVEGHTKGHTSYIVNDEDLFVADALSIENNKVSGFPSVANMDTKIAFASIDKLAKLENIKYIFTGHFGYSDDYKTLFDAN